MQIVAEFLYLLFLLVASTAALLWIGYVAAATSPADNRDFGIILYPRDRDLLLAITVALSGVVGGTAFFSEMALPFSGEMVMEQR